MQQKIIPYRHGNIIYLGFAFSGRRVTRKQDHPAGKAPCRAEVIMLDSRRQLLATA